MLKDLFQNENMLKKEISNASQKWYQMVDKINRETITSTSTLKVEIESNRNKICDLHNRN